MAYQVNDVLQAMKADSGVNLAALKVDGGASANNLLMQMQADISGAPVNRPMCVETTAMGAAYLAGLAVGYWSGKEDVLKNWAIDRTFAPAILRRRARRALQGLEQGRQVLLRLGQGLILSPGRRSRRQSGLFSASVPWGGPPRPAPG